ncbi:MAG: hypothetical protein KA015_05700 [Spirochaetes bacterium]|nr:hypothetical protein [Spirochaetota bacterium]
MKTHASAKLLLISLLVIVNIHAENIICRMESDCGKSFYIRQTEDFLIESTDDFYYAKPVLKEYSNFLPDEQHLNSSIEYNLIKINKGSIDIRSFLKKNYIGTHVFLRGNFSSNIILSSSLSADYPEHFIKLIIRKDDSYTGILHELFNTPFIWIPKKISTNHQTDEATGSDCISFVIYGRRRMNKTIQYIHPDKIINHTIDLNSEFCYQKNGIYLNQENKPLRITKYNIGDLVYFKAHVAVLYEDRGSQGILDKNDLVIHSIKTGAHISTIENCEYYHMPLKLLRWKD